MPEVSVGEYVTRLHFITWPHPITILTNKEHIVPAIRAAFDSQLFGPEDIPFLKTIDIVNMEVDNANT